MREAFFTQLKTYSESTSEYIQKYISRRVDFPNNLKEAMLYSIQAGGKRLRPALLLGTYGMYKTGTVGEVIPFAASVEMIHTYSLIHDDLPSMDDDDMRRGKPSNHIIFGEAAAILAGDALLNLSMENMLDNFSGAFLERKIKASRIIMDSAGAGGMIGGQIIDLKGASSEIMLKKMHTMKTGALIKAAVLSGGVLAGCSIADELLLEEFAENLGFAFQIKDDILDIEGESSVIGKPSGSDFRNDKTTYVTLYGTEKAKEMLESHISAAIDIMESMEMDTRFLKSLAEYIRDRKE